MPHGDIGVSAGFWVIVAVWAAVLLGSLAVGIDAFRPARRQKVAEFEAALGVAREPLWMYAVPGVLLLVLLGLSISPLTSMALSVIVAVVALFNVAIIPTYLLRIVFPKLPPCDEPAPEGTAVDLNPTGSADVSDPAATSDYPSPNEGA